MVLWDLAKTLWYSASIIFKTCYYGLEHANLREFWTSAMHNRPFYDRW